MTAALTRSSNVETFQFSASHAENCPSVGDVLISGGRLFHANGPATEKLRGPKPVVLDFWSAAQPAHPDLPSTSGDV